MRLVEYLPIAIRDLLQADERRVLLGEDIADGTSLGWSRAVLDTPELRHRVIPTPLLPAISCAHAAGLALAGLRPIVIFPGLTSLLEGFVGLREAAHRPERRVDGGGMPLLMIAPTGPGFALGGDAGEGTDATLARIAGLRIVVLGESSQGPALLQAAAEFWAGEEPTLVLFPRTLLLDAFDPNTAPQELDRPFAAARPVRGGDAATIFAWGETVALAIEAVDQSQVDARVIDVETLSPLDRPTLVDHARATGKIVIAHTGPRTGGVGAELAAIFAEDAIFALDAPIVRVTGVDGPLSGRREGLAIPAIADIVRAIVRVVDIKRGS